MDKAGYSHYAVIFNSPFLISQESTRFVNATASSSLKFADTVRPEPVEGQVREQVPLWFDKLTTNEVLFLTD